MGGLRGVVTHDSEIRKGCKVGGGSVLGFLFGFGNMDWRKGPWGRAAPKVDCSFYWGQRGQHHIHGFRP